MKTSFTIKRILLFTVALWLAMIGRGQTTQEIVIGNHNSSLERLPGNSVGTQYAYSQMLYFPDEIGTAGLITSIAFYKSSGPETQKNLTIFMKLTDRTEYDLVNHNDWEAVTTDDIYFDSVFSISGINNDWVSIPLSRPFVYDGESNLMIGYYDTSLHTVHNPEYQSFHCDIEHGNRRSKLDFIYYFSGYDPYNITTEPHTPGVYILTPGASWEYPIVKLTMFLADSSIVEVFPDSISFGDTPNNAWKHPQNVTISNLGLPGTLNTVGISGNYFSISGPSTPLSLPIGGSYSFSISTGSTVPGEVNENLEIGYSDDENHTIYTPVTAKAFTPVSPDVFELPRIVSSFPYSDSPTQLHNVYQLPGDNEDGPDAVYKMSFANDVLLTANVENGENPKIALYAEDFDGGGGPHSDNAYSGPQLIAPAEPLSNWLIYDNDRYVNSVGTGNVLAAYSNIYWGVKFTPEQLEQYDGCSLTKVKVFDRCSGQATLTIYMEGDEAPGREMTSQTFQFNNNSSVSNWKTINLTTPVMLDVTKNLWICVHSQGILYPAAFADYCGDPNSCWISEDGVAWDTLGEVSWMIRGFVTNQLGGRELRTEGEITDMTVEAGTYYLVASSTDEGFSVNINTETIPLPEVAYGPTPTGGATGVVQPLKLKWNFGEYTTGYRLLFGSTYPPANVVVDWTDDLNNEYPTGLIYNNTQYYWRVDERNSSGVTIGDVWGFTTTLNRPEKPYAEQIAIYEGDTAKLHWTAPADRTLRSYNIYRGNVLIGNTSETFFDVANLAYNMTGWQLRVTAVYDEGESAKSDPVRVKVSGTGSISGRITEQDLEVPIAGATVNLVGWDEHGVPRSYSFITDENGLYSGDILAGNYTAVAVKEGYQRKVFSNTVTIRRASETSNINFWLDEIYSTVGEVFAEDLGNATQIEWNNNTPAVQDPLWMYYDDGNHVDNIGYDDYGNLCWGVKFPDLSGNAGMQLSKVSYYDAEGWPGTITLKIYLGGSLSPERLVWTQGFTTTGSGDFVELTLGVPVEIDGTEPLWITCNSSDITFPASFCMDMGNRDGRWVSFDQGVTWHDHNDVSLISCTWMLRGYLEDENGNNRLLQYYNVYRSNCYDESSTELVATNLTDTVYMDNDWNNLEAGVYKWGVSKTYQGNRDSRDIQTLLSEDFEGGVIPEGWTSYGSGWLWTVAASCENNPDIVPNNSNFAAFCNTDGDSGCRYLVTPAIDLSTASSASLNYYYILPDWDGDYDDFYVKYSTSSTGPWTNLWTCYSPTWTWTEKTIDLTDLCGGVIYIAFVNCDYYGYCSAVDDVTVTADVYVPNQPHESAVVWSNCLDKDMVTTVDVSVVTNNTASPEGTLVSFTSVSEPDMGHDFEMVLDSTGRYRWEEFRKGTYLYRVALSEFTSCASYDTVVIWEPTSFDCLLEEVLHPVNNLYVSPTGWAMWSGDYHQQGDEFYYDFEDGTLGDWTLIDADGDGFNWKLGEQGGSPNIAGHNSTYCAYSESWDGSSLNELHPDNYLVSKLVHVEEGSVLSFYVCAQDASYPAEHYGVAVSTTNNTNPSAFTTIWEETLTSKSQGNWYYKEIDLGEFAGQRIYIALRHFNTIDEFCIDVDDISLGNRRNAKVPMTYKMILDGIWEGDVVKPYYQHDVNVLVPGQTYTTQVAPVYATGMGDWMSYEWTYKPCDEFANADNLELEVANDAVTLNWTLPELQQGLREGQWYYYDDGVCIDAIGTQTGASIYWAVMFPAGSYAGNKLTKVAMYDRDSTQHQGKIMIYQGGSTAPEQLLYTQNYETFGVNDFVEYDLNTPVNIDATENLWIVMNNTTGTYVASACYPSDDPNSGWVSLDGTTWDDIVNYGIYCSWMLRAYLVLENVDGIIGTMIWRDGELITEEPVEGESFTDVDVPDALHEYCIRVVHDGMPDSTYYAMSCPLCEQIEVWAVDELSATASTVFPNPTKDEVVIQAADMTHIRIVNALGQTVYDVDVEADETRVPMRGLGTGIYVIHITTGNGTYTHRVVVSGR